MNKTLILLILLCALNHPVHAFWQRKSKPVETAPKEQPCLKQHPLIEAKLGYFFFTSSSMSNVYTEGGFDVQLSGSYPVYKFLHIYGSAEYLQKSGYSQGFHEKTTFQGVPLSLGLRPVIPIRDYVSYYFTIGPRYLFAFIHNSSSYVPSHMHENGCGGFANTGFLFMLYDHLTFDIFGEYSYVKLHFHSGKAGTQGHTVQVGGLTFSAGLGYSF